MNSYIYNCIYIYTYPQKKLDKWITMEREICSSDQLLQFFFAAPELNRDTFFGGNMQVYKLK